MGRGRDDRFERQFALVCKHDDRLVSTVVYMVRMRLLLLLDVVLLVALALLEEPKFTSLGGHEWLGILFAALLVIHLVVNWRWIAATVARMRAGGSRRARTNAALNGALFVMMVVTVLSGAASSEVVLPLTGLAPSELAVWQRMHNLLSQLTLGVVGLHVALNWDWVMSAVRRGIVGRAGRRTVP
jgi:cytochrome b561